MQYFFYPVFLILSLIIIFASKKYNFFLDQKIDLHKKTFNPNKNFFLGGLFIYLFISVTHLIDKSYVLISFFSLIFLTGLLSDFKIINDPKKRFFFQAIIIFVFVTFLDIQIYSTKIETIDYYLKNKLLNNIFVVFCLMVLINGSNFLDGLNTLLVTYKISILIIFLISLKVLEMPYQNVYDLIFILLFVFTLNLFGIIILGDSGAYLLSIIFGLNLIEFASLNNYYSPYFIILLLWYPCFELLFSMIRRFYSKQKSYNPDTNHLHQLLYLKIFKNSNLNFKARHLILSLIINFYNFIVFYIGVHFIYSSKLLIFLIIFNISIYLIIYYFLITYNRKFIS